LKAVPRSVREIGCSQSKPASIKEMIGAGAEKRRLPYSQSHPSCPASCLAHLLGDNPHLKLLALPLTSVLLRPENRCPLLSDQPAINPAELYAIAAANGICVSCASACDVLASVRTIRAFIGR